MYSVYNDSGHPILEFIANPYLPPKAKSLWGRFPSTKLFKAENLIQATDIDNAGFPCLIITQAKAKENILSRTRYCDKTGQYIRLNETLTEIGTNLKGENLLYVELLSK